MKAWWLQLNSREQRLVSCMALAIFFFIIYSAIWQPMTASLEKNQLKLKKQQDLLTWVVDKTTYYQQAKKNTTSQASRGSLSSIINRSASSHNLTLARIQPQGEDLQVWIDSVAFNTLLFWLEHLANNQQIQVKAIDLMKSERAGEVKVRRLQLTKR